MVCIPDKYIIGTVVGYLLYKYLTRPLILTEYNSVKIHVDEYDKTIPSGLYDIVDPSIGTIVSIKDFSLNLIEELITDDKGDVYLIYDKYDLTLPTYTVSAVKYSYAGVSGSNFKIINLPSESVTLGIYKIYSEFEIIVE